MTDRLKNTILCSLLLARKYFIIILAAEILIGAVMFKIKQLVIFAWLTDFLPLQITMLSGLTFFERHNAFCTANAVSRRNRVISAAAVSAVTALLAAVPSCVIFTFTSDIRVAMTELIRTAAYPRMISCGNIFSDSIELFFFSEALFFLGYLIGGLRYKIGSALTMTILAALAAVMIGSIFLDTIVSVTPAMVLLYIPTLMQRSVFTAVLLSTISAAVFFMLSIKLSEATVEKRRGK